MGSFRDIRVLEIGEMVATPYASKLLGDLGADVIKVEPVGGDRARHIGPFSDDVDGATSQAQRHEQSGLFLGLNTNKRSRELDLTTPEGQAELTKLIAECDVLFHSLNVDEANAIGLEASSLLERHPSLVICAITPFGSTGPHAGWRGEEINLVHGGGWGYLIPGDDPDPNAPPLTVFGHPASCQAGMAAALVALAAWSKAEATGIGDYIDFSCMAHVASMLEASFIAWSYQGKVATRSEGRLLNPWGIYECSDGLIFLVTVEQDQWERLVEMMERPEWALLETFATNTDRAENRDVLDLYLNEWTKRFTVDDLFHRGQQQRICFAPVFTMADLADQPHLHQRGFFTTASHPVAGELSYMTAPYAMEPNPWSLTSAAPLLDEHRGQRFRSRKASVSHEPATAAACARRPLEGVRVIDFSWVWAGPFCTMHLSYLGAEVIKIESSSRPGLGRRLPIHPPEVEPTLNTSGYFNQWDQGKKSIELDLSNPASIETVLQLVAGAQVVVDNYATGVMDRLGLSDPVLFDANPDLIIASITGFGHDGPLANYMGYGPTTAPLSGLTSMTGHPGGRAEEAGISFGDPAAGLTAAFAVMAALYERSEGGRRIDVSLWEATATNAIDLWMAHALGTEPLDRMGSRTPWAAPHGVFPCAGDDRWISIACTSDEQWAAFASLLGDDALSPDFHAVAGRKENENRLEALVSQYTRRQDPWQLAEQLQGLGIASYPSLSCPEIESNEQLTSRGFWERFDHPEVGHRTHSGVPWRTHNADNGVTSRAPLLGEHTAEILGDLPRHPAT